MSQDNRDYKTKGGLVRLVWRFDDRYFKDNNWFYQVGNELYSSFRKYNIQDTSFNNTINSITTDETFTLGFGKGRIEWVQDAQMALYLLNDLERQGLLNKPVDHVTANAFAQLITAINNKRVFDSRKRRIYELTQIELLTTTGLWP
jgi:hypothetical protein